MFSEKMDSKVDRLEETIYSSSSEGSGIWIQPSLIEISIEPLYTTLIENVFVQTVEFNRIDFIDEEFEEEIEAWENASDFDFWEFEHSLEE